MQSKIKIDFNTDSSIDIVFTIFMNGSPPFPASIIIFYNDEIIPST